MRKLAILLIPLLLLALAIGAFGCDGKGTSTATPTPTPTVTLTPTPTPTPTPPREFTLADAPELLDLSALLGPTFEQLDPANEGLSKADLGLGPGSSEVVVYLREDAYHLIYAFIGINQSKAEHASFDAYIGDDGRVRAALEHNLQLRAWSEGVSDFEVVTFEVLRPRIGDAAALATICATFSGLRCGLDALMFRRGSVYVGVYAYYYCSETGLVSLESVGEEIDAKLLNW